MMSYIFNAKHAYVEDDGFVLVFGFSDDEFEPEKYVLLQKTLDSDEQDKKLGMDKVHIQVEDESRSIYGGVESMRFVNGKLHIILNSQGSTSLGIDGEIIVTLQCDSAIVNTILQKIKIAAADEFILYS